MGKGNIWKGAVAGLVGGLVASYVMNEYQSLVTRLTEGNEAPEAESDEPATVKVGQKISEKLFGHELTEREKKAADPIVHYATGAISGMFYGIVAEKAPRSNIGIGLPFGTGRWAILDEVIVSALGLSKSSLEYPLSNRAYALSSHLVPRILSGTVSGSYCDHRRRHYGDQPVMLIDASAPGDIFAAGKSFSSCATCIWPHGANK